jgi:FkbM family methyltransferase
VRTRGFTASGRSWPRPELRTHLLTAVRLVTCAPVQKLKLLLARNRHLYRWSMFGRHVIRFLLRRPHDPDFAAFARFADRPGSFLDIGGNTGQSALAFRLVNRRAPILSIEANPLNEPELRFVRRLLRRFDYLICAAGEAPGTATLHIPVYRGLPLTGEASLHGTIDDTWWLQETGASAEAVEMREVSVAVRRLDDMRLDPAFVKIDVEGAEPQVLNGLTETIERHRPIFLIEDGDDVHDALVGFFGERRYRTLEYVPEEDRLREPVDRSARNLFFVPEELSGV